LGPVEIVPFPNGSGPALSRAERAVADPLIDPTNRLEVILSEVRRAKDDLDRQRYLAETLPGGTSDDVVQDQERRCRNAYRRWFEAQSQATQLEAETRRRRLEDLSLFQHVFEETRDSLLEEYGDLGPHYDLLVQRMAAVDTRIKLIERSGRDIDPGEYNELSKTWLSYLNQLQKYTEAQKTEVMSRQTQEVVNQVLLVIEHRISNQNPQLWREIVGDVRKAIEAVA
jgi:hypothetical protein